MKTEMKKEILTKENCKLDLIRPPISLLSRVIAVALALVVFGVLALIVFYVPGIVSYVAAGAFGAFVLLILAAIPLDDWVRHRKNRRISAGKFHIEQDVLVKVILDAPCHIPYRGDTGLRDVLEFSGHERYCFERVKGRILLSDIDRTYYKWSDLNKMSVEGIINTSLEGDTFYLVVYDDDPERKPVMVYNAKFFDYNAELWENG